MKKNFTVETAYSAFPCRVEGTEEEIKEFEEALENYEE